MAQTSVCAPSAGLFGDPYLRSVEFLRHLGQFDRVHWAAEQQGEKIQILTEETCHVCGAPMALKFGRTGRFLSCSKYPECKATRPMEGGPRAAAVETEHTCPKCGKPLMLRESKQRRLDGYTNRGKPSRVLNRLP